MGAVGGTIWHGIKGARNSPRGERLPGSLSAIKARAPVLGGNFGVWGGMFSSFDCAVKGIRQKEDPWNAIIAGFILSYSALVSDVSHYLRPDVSPHKLFWSVYFGFFLSCVPFIMIGAAFACSSYDNPVWSDALSVSSGQFFQLILAGSLGNFGRFLVVLLALSVCGNISATIYSIGLNFQTLLPFLGPVPRFVWPLFAFAIFLPLAIVGHSKFYETLTDFTSVLGYWASLYVGVVTADHVIFRKRDYTSYNARHWNRWGQLPPGLAALAACCISCVARVGPLVIQPHSASQRRRCGPTHLERPVTSRPGSLRRSARLWVGSGGARPRSGRPVAARCCGVP